MTHDEKDAKDKLMATAKAAADLKPDEAETMRLRKLSPADRAKRIAEIQAELDLLNLPPYVEYPKVLADGRTVNSAAEEKTPVAPDPPPEKPKPVKP